MNFAQYCATHGFVSTADVDSHIHAGLRNAPQTKTYRRWFNRRLIELQDSRDEAMRLYRSEIMAGTIRQPSRNEALVRTAQGHPDNPAVQAARRVCAKRGIDWQ